MASAGSCGSVIQSPGPGPCARPVLHLYRLHTFAVPLLPKVRGQFAEFLNQGSLVHLSLLDQPTCVGVRYGHGFLPRRPFSPAVSHGTRGQVALAPCGHLSARRPTGFNGARLAAPAISLSPACSTIPVVQDCPPAVHRSALVARSLGPTNPPRITRAAEPSGFRRWGFAPHFSVTHSDIRTRTRSTAGFRCRFVARATLPYRCGCPHPRASVRGFAPLDCRRRGTRPVSSYALFEGWLLLSQPPGCLRTATSLPTQPRLGDLSCGSGLLPF